MAPRTAVLHDQALLFQAVFRALLSAMSRPGRVASLPRASGGQAGDGMSGCMLIMQSLLDHEVSFCALQGGEADHALERRISDLTGACATVVAKADFVLVRKGDSRGCVRMAKRGTWEFPEDGATVIYHVKDLLEGADVGEEIRIDGGFLSLRLFGPGVKGERRLLVSGLQRAEVEALSDARKQFPLGIEAILCDEKGDIACLPRSTRVAVEAGGEDRIWGM